MTLNKVIELAEIANKPSFTDTPFLILYGFILIAIAAVNTYFSLVEEERKNKNLHLVFSTILGLGGLGVALTAPLLQGMETTTSRIETWEKEVLTPYLQEQPNEKASIASITPIRTIANRLITTEDKPLEVYLKIEYIDKGQYRTQVGTYHIFQADEGVEEPYITYVSIPKDILRAYPKGNYITAVYVPKGYSVK